MKRLVDKKLIFITRVYSALESSLISGKWIPQGMPAITLLWELLSEKEIPFEVYLTSNSVNSRSGIKKINFKFPNATFHVIWGSGWLKKKFKSYGIKLNSIIVKMTAFFWILTKEHRGQIYYVDRENVVLGAILYYLFSGKVVLRLHGVANLFNQFSTFSGKLKHPIRYFSFRTPFDMIISTDDGSKVRQFLTSFTSQKSEKHIMINGVPEKVNTILPKSSIKLEKSYRTILFVSRLTKSKGVTEFCEVVEKLFRDGIKCNVIMIGGGEYSDHVKKLLPKSPLIHLLGPLGHESVQYYYTVSDLLVSLNEYGDLSNVVLEALSNNLCILSMKGENNYYNHVESVNSILDKCIIYIENENIKKQLYNNIYMLLENDIEIENRRKLVRTIGSQLLMSWRLRILNEIRLFGGE